MNRFVMAKTTMLKLRDTQMDLRGSIMSSSAMHGMPLSSFHVR